MYNHDEGSKKQFFKQLMLIEQQRNDIQVIGRGIILAAIYKFLKTARKDTTFLICVDVLQELKLTLHGTKAGIQFLQTNYQEEFNKLGTYFKKLVRFLWVFRGGIAHLILISYLIGKHLHGLAHAATSYQRVLEENRKLYNQVQDLKGKNPNGHS